MAEEATPQGNIRQEFNNATVGLNLDQTVNQIKPGTLTYALNAAVENFDASSINYQNEQGNEFCLQFPENYVLIGTYFISEKSKHIFFLVNPNTNSYGCEIGYMDNNDCIYHTLVSATCLNFQVNHPIHKVVHRITNCTVEIYWTDGLNPRRYLDILNIPYILESGTPLCTPEYTNQLDCNQLKIQPNFDIPQLEVVDIPTGGNIISGVYQFAAQYSDASGNGYTSYYSVTNPTPIADAEINSRDFNYPVGKSIVVDVSHLDLTGQFQYFNLAVIKTVNAITSVELIGTYFIEEASRRVTYTGQIVDNIRLSINDIFEKYPFYDVAEDLTTAQDILIWDGLKSNERINYQKIANQVSLLWETYRIPKGENYSDELNATNLRGYLRDEVYAFELVFLLDNGMQTDGFHIPGRAKTSLDEFPYVYTSNPDFIGDPIDTTDYNYRWTVYNTATVLGTATGDKIGNATPYQYGTFSYWESKEDYPCETDIWGELAGTPIRHHKFPDVSVSPIYDPRIFSGVGSMVMGNNDVFPIGVRLDVDQIKSLIASSDLTQNQKDSIVGFKIVRGDRSTNKSIIAKGILRNVGKYRRESQNYYYPNYPYNDLKEDPFLNSTNNAWQEECQSFDINVIAFNLPVGNPTYLEVKYSDCDTNKPVFIKYTTKGIKKLCSISVPLIQGAGLKNAMNLVPGNLYQPAANCIGTVSYSNYDQYLIEAGGQGWRASWQDAMPGLILNGSLNSSPTTTFLSGGLFGGRSYRIKVRVDTVPSKIGGPGTPEIIGPAKFRNTDCERETPQPAINDNTNLAYRQVFNSPETSFGQPFVGTGQVLKLENVMFGKGLAHFVQVKGNAKYRLLTEEAQRDALKSSKDIADITDPFSASAMFAAYQSYLTIYINGITRKNYAYSFNSIADYNYLMAIPNDIGVKQRTLDVAKYLIPGVQSTGIDIDDHPINNYQRESSVYLKTIDKSPYDGTTINPLPFPDKSPYMVSAGTSIIEERSRFTISGSDSCNTPEREQDIEVVSYYASLKNISVSQWGQIYSYQTIDTGFQEILKDSSGIKVVFGGDTFINRFAFKTKLPFFIDNRVNAPDDSDIFYDEIGNIAYPKFWHSARSILKDYVVNSTPMSNIISYKAHNFDCPNSQEPGPTSTPSVAADQNPDRTFYDGYFYLFAYGVPNFYCESSYNVDLRQAYDNRAGDFWPHVSNNIPDDWVQENYVSIVNDNTYTYNTTFSKQNKENTFLHLPADFKPGNKCFTEYPFRAIYSDPQSTDADNRVNNWLIYRALSYFDFPQNYGNLISLDGIQNKAILARFDNKSLMYNNLLTLDTSNPQAAYLGNPNLFKGAPPIDFAETDLGYVGSQNKFFLKIPNGQITIDAKRGQVFLVVGTQVQDLSASGSGMNRFFTDHLAFEILRYFPEVDTDNHFNGVGLHGVFDTKFDRVIITKLDYIPLRNNISYDKDLKEYFIEEGNIQRQIYLTDTEYFCNKSWTLSFNFNTKSWVSFHSYIPNFYIGENNFFYSGINGCCDEFDFIAGPLVVGPSTTTTTTRQLTTTTTTTRILNCNLGGNAIEVTTTTTTTLPLTTTTTTSFVPIDCISITATTSSITELPIVYIDCNNMQQTIYVGGGSGNSITFCLYNIISISNQISIDSINECTTTTTTTLPPTTTTTTTILTCNAPILGSPTITPAITNFKARVAADGGVFEAEQCIPTLENNININVTYSSGLSCQNLITEYSTNNINWISSTGSCVSTIVFNKVPSTVTYYRVRIACVGGSNSNYSNTVVYVPPTTTTTTTTLTCNAPTLSSPFISSGNINVNVNYNGGAACGTLLFESSTNNVNWSSNAGGCVSTFVVGAVPSVTTYYRAKIFCPSVPSSPYSNTVIYVPPTTTTTTTLNCNLAGTAFEITTTTTTTLPPSTTTTTTTLPLILCNGTSDAGGQGLKDLSVNLDPSGGVVVFLFNPDNFVDKLEIYHGTPQNGGVNKKSTTSMTATTNNNVFDNVWGTPPSNSLPNNVALPVDQFIGNSKGTAPTRQTQFTADTGFTIPSMTIGGSTYQQIIWWKYTSADYLTNNKATIRVTGGSNGTAWNSLRFCPPTTTTTTTTPPITTTTTTTPTPPLNLVFNFSAGTGSGRARLYINSVLVNDVTSSFSQTYTVPVGTRVKVIVDSSSCSGVNNLANAYVYGGTPMDGQSCDPASTTYTYEEYIVSSAQAPDVLVYCVATCSDTCISPN